MKELNTLNGIYHKIVMVVLNLSRENDWQLVIKTEKVSQREN